MSGRLLAQRDAVVAPKQRRTCSVTNSEGEESSHTSFVEVITPGRGSDRVAPTIQMDLGDWPVPARDYLRIADNP